ncbi:MAG: glycosyltransferase family 2 protein [Flavobacteriales bacterium]|nr:glycosyltransferase family 2 protein [Flavobacteriales bacterium]
MLNSKKICVVIPAYNEENLIESTIVNLPHFVDYVFVVNDNSTDNTRKIVTNLAEKRDTISLVNHEVNMGVGASVAKGMRDALETDAEIFLKIDGDGQMSPDDIIKLVESISQDECDFAKGNRFFSREAYDKMPKVRFYGNAFLSLFTKIVSGYWNVADSQSGFICLSRKAVTSIDWNSMYKRYGQPNDLLVRANVANLRVKDIAVEPIYGIGEKSTMRISKVLFTIPVLLIRLFLWRIKEKYVIRNFHPLVLFYLLGSTFGFLFFLLGCRLAYYYLLSGILYKINSLAVMFSFMSSSMFILFAMWFDMEENKKYSIRN